MLTARRMRERQLAEAAGLPPPQPRRPLEISVIEHDRVVAELQEQLRQALAKGQHSVELRLDEEPFKSALSDLEAKAKEAIDAAVAENTELTAQVEALSTSQAAATDVAPTDSGASEADTVADASKPKGAKPKVR